MTHQIWADGGQQPQKDRYREPTDAGTPGSARVSVVTNPTRQTLVAIGPEGGV